MQSDSGQEKVHSLIVLSWWCDDVSVAVVVFLVEFGIRGKRRRNRIQFAAYDEFDSRLFLLTYLFFVFYHSVIQSFAFSFHSIQFNSIPLHFIGNTIYGNILNWYNFGFCLFAKYFVNPIKRFITSPSSTSAASEVSRYCRYPKAYPYMNYVPFVDADVVDCHKWNVNWNLVLTLVRLGLAWLSFGMGTNKRDKIFSGQPFRKVIWKMMSFELNFNLGTFHHTSNWNELEWNFGLIVQ